MRFIADAMFGKLARWLRMSGYDTLYCDSYDDSDIISLAKKEKRVIITRDKKLFRKAIKRGIKVIFLPARDFVTNLKILEKEHGLNFHAEPIFARCAVCNGELEKIGKEEAEENKVIEKISRKYELWRCRECKKIYWHGSHWKNIEKIIERVKI